MARGEVGFIDDFPGRNSMPKGQQRSNREHKKPKQSKLKPVPVSPFAATPVRPAAPVPGKKK
jgi:hypothetical protein